MNFLQKIRRTAINCYIALKNPDTIDLWVDDMRPAPMGWYHVTNYAEAVDAFNHYNIDRLCLDHDLGEAKTGYDFVKYVVEQTEEDLRLWPKERPFIITSNPVGRRNMAQLIDRYGPYKKYNFN